MQAGGAVRIVANEIENLSLCAEMHQVQMVEPSSTYLRDAGGAGGRVALLADGNLVQGMINLNGGTANADGVAGFRLYLPARNQVIVQPLSVESGTLVLIQAEPGITVLELEGRVNYHLNILKLEVLGMDIPFVVSILPLSRLVPMWSSVFRVMNY